MSMTAKALDHLRPRPPRAARREQYTRLQKSRLPGVQQSYARPSNARPRAYGQST